jgi:hypothetical protein
MTVRHEKLSLFVTSGATREGHAMRGFGRYGKLEEMQGMTNDPAMTHQ